MRMKVSGQNILTILVFAALTFGLYPLLLQGFFHDDYGLVSSPNSRRWWQAFDPRYPAVHYHYAPIRLCIFSMVNFLAGSKRWPYHFVSLLMQTMHVILWYKLSQRFCRVWIVRLVLIGVLSFMPFVSEAVFWVGACDQVMGSAAYLASVYLFLRFAESNRAWHLAGSTVAYAFGLFTNAMLITLPVLLGLMLLDPDGWRISSRRHSLKPLVAYAVITIVYLLLHAAAADPTLMRSAGISFRPGVHNIRNLAFAAEVALVAPTLFHRDGTGTFWMMFNNPSNAPLIRIYSATVFLCALAWRPTRTLAAWLILALLPYILRVDCPQGARYYHLPAAIVLLMVSAGLGACVKHWKRCFLPVAIALLFWFWSCLDVWLTRDDSFYRGMCQEGESAVERVVRSIPDNLSPDKTIYIINDLPFAVRHLIKSAVRMGLNERANGASKIVYKVVYCRDIDHYWASNPASVPDEKGWCVPMGLTLLTKNPWDDPYEFDNPVPITRPIFRSSTEVCWNVMHPFPGALAWQFNPERAATGNDMRVVLEELSSDHHAATPLRITTWPLASTKGRARLPRPVNNSWARLHLIGPDSERLKLDSLRLEP